jgi:phosphoribosylcarboxyaminoimidazole (NCAIR) mutase
MNVNTPLVSIVMGSDSDLDIMNEAAKALADFGIAVRNRHHLGASLARPHQLSTRVA